MNKKFKSYAALAGAMILAGSSVIVSKLLVQRFPVFLASGISLLFALIVLIPVCIYKYGFKLNLSYKTLFILFLQALTGTFLFRTLLFFGINKTSATTGGIITSSAPVMVTLLALLILRERFMWNKAIGITLTVAGIIIANVISSSGRESDTFLGNLLVLFAVLGESLFSILSKIIDNKISPILKTTIVCFFALICFMPFSIYDFMHIEILKVDYKIWLYLIYYGLFITVLAFILWFKGIAEVPASTSAVFSGFMPLSSITLSCTILQEEITSFHVLSLILIILGLITTLKPSMFKILFLGIMKLAPQASYNRIGLK